MSDVENPDQPEHEGSTAPALKDGIPRPHGETLKTMNPAPNGYPPSMSEISDSEVPKKSVSNDAAGKSAETNHSSEHKKKDHEKHHKKHKEDKDHDKHKESSKDKHKDPSKSSSKEKSKKEGEKPNKENEVKHKHKDSSHKSSHKDKEKHKEKDGTSSGKTDSEKHKEKKHEHKDKHKDGHDKHKDGHDKHKDGHDKHKDGHKDKHKDKHKEKHKDKDGHRDKHKDEKKLKDEQKEKHKEKSREGGSEKEKSKEGSSEKHKQKDKEHKSKHKEKDKPVDKVKVKTEIMEEEYEEDSPKLVIKEESMSDEGDRTPPPPPSKKKIKREVESDDDYGAPKKKLKTDKSAKKRKIKEESDFEEDEEEYDDDYGAPKKAKKAAKKPAAKGKKKAEPAATASPRKRVKKEVEEEEVWKWWEEEKLDDGQKWRTLEHHGPVFPPPYERVPKSVKFYYDKKHMVLSEETEEVAGFYGRMLDHDYTKKEVFNKNFFKDWRKVMTPEEREVIIDLKKCNFNDFNNYYKMKSEERKARSKEEKQKEKLENEELLKKFGFCIVDGHKQKIGNFKLEPPGLFRGRGEHPKMGMLKKRMQAEGIIINIGKEAKVPEPPPGHKWKEVRHDKTVSWLVSWSENILGAIKYIMLNPSSKLKGEKDFMKYEKARELKSRAEGIRKQYTQDFKSKEMRVRQRAVALYFIDKLALRAGNEKDEDTADTVGCCSLRVEHITLHNELDGKENVVQFDFLGKDSIRYENAVAIEKRAFKNLKLFMENKQPKDDLFDRLNTQILNKYLNDLMDGLTAKVFRTYNASKTLQEQLDLLTEENMSLPEKILAYNRANRSVAILCNHQRAVPKGFDKSMDTLKQKMDDKKAQIKELQSELKGVKRGKDGAPKDPAYDKKKKRLDVLKEQLKKLDVQAVDREENKQIALGTSKLNYLDPRISVAWCKKWDVPIDKIYNKTQRDKFRWAIEMVGPEYKF